MSQLYDKLHISAITGTDAELKADDSQAVLDLIVACAKHATSGSPDGDINDALKRLLAK